jgi:ribosomal protein S18 acetylase RimI-like enzyme
MTIRPANEADYPAAHRLFQVLMGESFDLDRDLFCEVCRGPGDLAIVAETPDAGVVGIVVAVLSNRLRLSANTRRWRFHIDQLIVFPEHRRRGIGRALVAHIAELARSKAPSYIIVDCDFEQVAARRTYEAAGFHLVRQAHDRFELAFS